MTGLRTAFGSLRTALAALLFVAVLGTFGCEGPIGEEQGEGPGHRAQVLALNPREELQLGRQAYREILSNPSKYGHVFPGNSPETERVRGVAAHIIKATEIRPLMREMNLHPGRFDWEINVLDSPQINAFCLPGGKIAVFSGLLEVVQNDDQLAAVIGHETAHALAHHVSERIAYEQQGGSPLAMLRGKAFDRSQEDEADHIGIFLMTFAGYNPEDAVRLWQRMEQLSAQRPHVPEILSDHPSDEHRLRHIAGWVPRAWAAKHAYEEGHVEQEANNMRRGEPSSLWAVFDRNGLHQASAKDRIVFNLVSASREEGRR